MPSPGPDLNAQSGTQRNPHCAVLAKCKTLGRWAFTDETRCQAFFYAGNLPGFERGVKLRVVEDDGSDAFSRRHMALFERGL